jgi:hypothetical protein
MFGPDANLVLVVYSHGWGQDGESDTLLFFTQDADGSCKWHGLVFSGNNFSS